MMDRFKIQNSPAPKLKQCGGRLAEREKLKVRFLIAKILFLCFSFALCTLGFTLNCYAQEKIIAIVGSEVITRGDLHDFSNFMRMQMAQEYTGKELDDKMKEMEPEFLWKLIEDRLILQQARKDGIILNPEVLESRIDEIKGNYRSEADFHDDLSSQGITQADLEEKISEQMLMYAVIEENVRGKIIVTPTEVTTYYQQYSQDFKEPQLWEFRTLRIDDRDLVNKVSRAVKNGEGLEDLAQKYSLSMNKIRVYRGGQLREDIEKRVFDLKPGESSKPFKIDHAYYIFRLDNLIPPRELSLDEVQEEIRLILINNEMDEKMDLWLQELKDLSYIKTFK